MNYLEWDKSDIPNIESIHGLVKVLTEVDSVGSVLKEIGLTDRDDIFYKSDGVFDNYMRLFDLSVIETEGLEDDLSRDDFYKLWTA